MTNTQIFRGRFNQPSTLQPHHDLHWRTVIVEDRDPQSSTIIVHFTEGDVHSMKVMRIHVTNIGLNGQYR